MTRNIYFSRRMSTLLTGLSYHHFGLFLYSLNILSGTAAMMCGVPGRAENGTQVSLFSATVYNPGQKAEYSCHSGLVLLGDAIRTCQIDGSWSGSRPRCVDNLAYRKPVASSRVVNHYKPDLVVDGNTASCIYLDTRVEDRFIQIDLGKNYLISGIVLHMPDGYVQELALFIAEKLESANGIQYRRCTKGLSRINAHRVQIECRREDGAPTAIPGRFLHIRDERKIHDFYFTLCEIEIYSQPDKSLGCGVPDQPAFASPANTSQLLEEKYRNTFELSCKTGFILSGPKEVRCHNGSWIANEISQCLAVECQPLPSLMNGYIDLFPIRGLNNNSFNTVARHRCSDGYMIVGEATRTCDQVGKWTGTPPVCQPTDCQLPRSVSKAIYKLVNNHTKPGAIVQYTCHDGYVPQRILADKPLQTVIVCQKSGLWREGNFYCSLRSTYYPPVSNPFPTATDKSSEPERGTESPTTIFYTSFRQLPNQSSFQEIEFTPPTITSHNVDLEATETSTIISSLSTDTSSRVSRTDASESDRSTSTAIAATGFVATFIMILLVIVGVTLNLCRMRSAFDRVKNRCLLASANLVTRISSNKGTPNSYGNKTIEEIAGSGRPTTVKMEPEPIYNELESFYVRDPQLHVLSTTSQIVAFEAETAFLDTGIEKLDIAKKNNSFEFSSDKYHRDNLVHNDSSFIESKPSLTPDEIFLLYAKVDKTKKAKHHIFSSESMQQSTNDETIHDVKRDRNDHPRYVYPQGIDSVQRKSTNCKIRNFHPKKVNNMQLPKTVVEVTLDEYLVEHSRICFEEKNLNYALENRPLPALPSNSVEN